MDWQHHFLNYVLIDNRVKQFRFKLIHIIIATKENLFNWKISDTALCNSCGDIDTVEHFLLHCKHLDNLLVKRSCVFNQCGLAIQMRRFKYFLFGYRVEHIEYKWFNTILSYIGYATYKYYVCCDHQKNHQTVLKVLIDELRTSIKYFECKQIKCSLLTKFLKGILELRD